MILMFIKALKLMAASNSGGFVVPCEIVPGNCHEVSDGLDDDEEVRYIWGA